MRIVFHIDMDAFFAACEERYNPQFRGKPIVVGADPRSGKGRGVVSTANYAARKYGIKSAMPISRAWHLSEEAKKRGEPAAIFLTGNYRLYSEISERIMKILAENADAFEQASVDEAYLEPKLPPPLKLRRAGKVQSSKLKADKWAEAEELARKIKKDILEQEGLTCSVGIGPNKLVAKVASDFKKPDGLTVVRPEKVRDFLDPMSVRVIPGVGPKAETFLRGKGIKIIRELRARGESELIEWFGKWGEELWKKARGISDSPVSNEWEAKSIGEQETFEKDTLDPAFILDRVRSLAAQVFARVQNDGFKSFRTVVITVRFADFITKTRSHTAPKPLAALNALNGETLRLLLPFLDRRENPAHKAIRLIGVRVEKLLS